jgi:uncharacterized glyoxalase superfamily protein PhnB/uncharacterized protein YndB with AHSA1/START domain
MKNNVLFNFIVNKENNTVNVEREFTANLDLVWDAWTKPEILDLWWAPKPYKNITKSMDFREGGMWLYYMESPQGETHWCKNDYLKIDPKKSYTGLDAFCDESGSVNKAMPRTQWTNSFKEQGDSTIVSIVATYEKLSDLEKIIEMGFKEGFTMALGNLDDYLQQRLALRNELKTDNNARVVTYLNFPGNTEEAFSFYKNVFRSEFSGNGIQRFGDIPAQAGHPPVADNIKKMILHVELPILGGHVLMATDAPAEMGFSLIQGNNMHISLEPESRAETQRLFDELSADGAITMPLEDMFFGSFFGSCTDKFGINWMFNFKN